MDLSVPRLSFPVVPIINGRLFAYGDSTLEATFPVVSEPGAGFRVVRTITTPYEAEFLVEGAPWPLVVDSESIAPNKRFTDAAGNTYLAGHFQANMPDSDPGPGHYHVARAGNQDAFVAKLHPYRGLGLGSNDRRSRRHHPRLHHNRRV